MNRADAFASDMCRVLEQRLGMDWKPEPRKKGQQECVDVIGSKNKKPRVLIEVELRRTTPLGNVVKVWKRVNQGIYPNNIVMFQAFSLFYPKEGTRRKNAEFVGQQMQEACGVTYIPLSINYRPAKRYAGQPVMAGKGRRRDHAEELARNVLRRLTKFYNRSKFD